MFSIGDCKIFMYVCLDGNYRFFFDPRRFDDIKSYCESLSSNIIALIKLQQVRCLSNLDHNFEE